MASDDDARAALRTERLAMVALLEPLSDRQWASPSLCDGWTVQDVAAHVAFAPVAMPWETLPAMVRSGFNVNRFIGDGARRWARRGRETILEQLRTNAETGRGPLGMPSGAVMTDAVIHLADVGRPLGRRHEVPPAALESAAGFLLGPASQWPLTLPMGGSPRSRVRGLRLVADDADWSWGEGDELRASAETLLMLLAGRPVEVVPDAP